MSAPRPFVPLPCAVLHGYVAHVIAVVLERHLAEEIRQYPPERQVAVLGTFEAVRDAADAWRAAQQAQALTERGNAAHLRSGAPALLDQITTKELARMLGVKERQARNVGRDRALGARVGSTWVWSRAATLAHLEQRRSA